MTYYPKSKQFVWYNSAGDSQATALTKVGIYTFRLETYFRLPH
jgi:hypothetical protein